MSAEAADTAQDEAEDEATVCVVCGKELPDDAAAIAHLNEALEFERLRALRGVPA